MSFSKKKVTPLQEYKDDGVIVDEETNEKIPQPPAAFKVALERDKKYSFGKDFAKFYKGELEQ